MPPCSIPVMNSSYSYIKINEFDVDNDSKTTIHSQLESDIQDRLGWLRRPSVSDCSRKNSKYLAERGVGVLASS